MGQASLPGDGATAQPGKAGSGGGSLRADRATANESAKEPLHYRSGRSRARSGRGLRERWRHRARARADRRAGCREALRRGRGCRARQPWRSWVNPWRDSRGSPSSPPAPAATSAARSPGFDLGDPLLGGDGAPGIDVLEALLDLPEHVEPVDDLIEWNTSSGSRSMAWRASCWRSTSALRLRGISVDSLSTTARVHAWRRAIGWLKGESAPLDSSSHPLGIVGRVIGGVHPNPAGGAVRYHWVRRRAEGGWNADSRLWHPRGHPKMPHLA